MYNLSEETKELFQSQSWKVDMTITLAPDDVVLTVTDKNLVMGTLTVDRYVSTGTELPVGTAAAVGKITNPINQKPKGFTTTQQWLICNSHLIISNKL